MHRQIARGSAFFAADSEEPTFMGEGVQKDKAPKRRRATTKTGSGPKKRQTKKTFDTKPCAACLHPNHPMQDCWAVIGAPEGRYVSQEKKREVEKKRKKDPEFENLVKEVLRLNMDNTEDAD